MIHDDRFLTHPPLPFNREVTSHRNLRPLLMLPVQRGLLEAMLSIKSTCRESQHYSFELHSCWLCGSFWGWSFMVRVRHGLSATAATVQELHSWISLKFTCRGLLAQPLQEDSLVLATVSMMQLFQVRMHPKTCHARPKNLTLSYPFNTNLTSWPCWGGTLVHMACFVHIPNLL